MREIYDWVGWFRELCGNIAENEPAYLIDRARRVKWKADGGGPALLRHGESNIDPFSFVYTLAGYEPSRRLVYPSVTKEFGLTSNVPIENDDAFIFPIPMLLIALFNDEGRADKNLLWRLFKCAVSGINEVNAEDFVRVQEIKGVAAAKLTQALFLINADEFLPYDKYSFSFMNRTDKVGKAVSWHEYREMLEKCRKTFPGCAPYEINYLGYETQSPSESLPLNQDKQWQISSRAFGDSNPDMWEDFQSNNHAYTGGPGNQLSWDEFDETRHSVGYRIQNAKRGDLLLVRSGGNGRGIGVITKNDYAHSPGNESRIHVAWLAKKETKLSGEFYRSLGFSEAHTIGSYFRQAYPETYEFLKTKGPPRPNDHGILQQQPLNSILYGPPGTGKTYRTFARCVEICDGIRDTDSDVRSRYDALVEEGRIEFVTFHQSYGYEEFVEGIRPREKNGSVIYQVEAGILKRLANRSRVWSTLEEHTNRSRVSFEDVWSKLLEYAQKGNIERTKTDSGEYRLEPVDETRVELKGVNNENDGRFSKKSIRKIWEEFFPENPRDVRPTDITSKTREFGTRGWILYNLLWEFAQEVRTVEEPINRPPPNYVLVIDEINRANISKVMGELITLLEEDKREGAENEIKLTLPYSGDSFSLPPNLHILGTMNTADRSIALIDTALRRRFKFEEVAPDPDLLSDAQAETKLDLPLVLKTINSRLEYLVDRDHLIGHAWLMNATSREDVDEIMRHKIIPLLAEYFYDDWTKVRAVLGNSDHFIKRVRLKTPPGLEEDSVEDRYQWTVQDTFDEGAYEALVGEAGDSTSSE